MAMDAVDDVCKENQFIYGMKDKDKVDKQKRSMKNEKEMEMEMEMETEKEKTFSGECKWTEESDRQTDRETGMNHLHFTKKWDKALFTFFTERD
ncbi:unnamed protein product [[Candida] boidinii]|nr:unnamed protein product [[Candida] boidinii]